LLFFNSLRGTLFAVNADTGKVEWNSTVTVNCGTTDCITKSTPVIDPSGQYVYCWRIDGTVRKYEIGTGKEVIGNGFPSQMTYIPTYEQGSSPLNIIDNILYMTTSGDNHDDDWYDGHIVSVHLTTGETQVWNSLCSNKRSLLRETDCTIVDRNGAGIWSRGSAVEEPLDGSIYIAMGNGLFDPKNSYWADSIVRLRPGLPNTSNVMLDSYTPSDYLNMQTKDYDLGSSAPCILPQISTSKTPYMLVQASKDAVLRLINRQDMSGKGCCGNVGGEVHSVNYTDGFVFTQPLAWEDPSTHVVWVYVVTTTAATKTGTGFHAYTILTDKNGISTLNLNYTLPNAGTSPFVANNILYFQISNAVKAINPATGKTLWTSSTTTGLHYQSPIVINGHIYSADNSGNVYGWGLP